MSINEIIDKVEEERKTRGISVAELCDRAGIARYTYYHWIDKRTSPTISSLSTVLDVLGMRIEVLTAWQ